MPLDCEELPTRGFYGIQNSQSYVLDIGGDERDELIFTFPDETFVYQAKETK